MATKLTARAHSFCFLRLKFYFIAIGHILKGEKYHQAEMAGILLVSVGITMALWDSLNLPVGEDDLAFYLSNSPL
jgi:EamA domain-containing membrane protein RarD